MLKLNAQEFRVLISPRPLVSRNGKFAVLGYKDDASNLVMIDGSMPDSRQKETALHEIIHDADEFLVESQVRSLGVRLYGHLAENGMLREGWFDDVVDGEATEAEINLVIDELDRMAAGMADMGSMPMMRKAARANAPAAIGVGDPPQTAGEPGTGAEPAGTIPPGKQPGAAGGGGDPHGQGAEDVSALKSALQAERSGRKAAEKEANTVKARLAALETANLSQAEKDAKRVKDLEAENAAIKAATTGTARRAAFTVAAVRDGVVDPEAAFILSDQNSLVVDEAGNVAGVAEALTALRTSRPYLFGRVAGSPGAAGARGTDAGAAGATQTAVTPEQAAMAAKLGAKLA